MCRRILVSQLLVITSRDRVVRVIYGDELERVFEGRPLIFLGRFEIPTIHEDIASALHWQIRVLFFE